jgi:hypothetical protein
MASMTRKFSVRLAGSTDEKIGARAYALGFINY